MFSLITLLSAIYFDRYTGELAGMRNVILQPQYIVGMVNNLDLNSLPEWHNSIDLYGIYGSAKTGTGDTSSQLQEVRGKITSLYTIYNQDDVFRVNTGLYSLFAHPLHHYLPYRDPDPNIEYAEDENERLSSELLLGLDLNFATRYDKIASSLHNIIFLGGQKMAPNLLAYIPSLGFDWTNEIFLWGTEKQPRLSIVMNMKFWLARKADVSFFNSHDGIGGTKREFYIDYGINYWFNKKLELSVKSYGYNNLNRGTGVSTPIDFKDGAVIDLRYNF
jgi:hypothetical protein